MNLFEFSTVNRIICGPGSLAQIGAVAAPLGTKALVVTGANPKRAQRLFDLLHAESIAAESFSVTGEPSIETVRAGADVARSAGCDLVIGIGGGSVVDSAKAIAALLTNEGDVLEYLEVVGDGKSLTSEAAPCIAIPTTSGTGSEVTKNSVLAVPEERVKVSLRSSSMLPNVALVDPELTYALPADVTASSGMDAIVQLIEPLVSVQANPLTDGIARGGLRRAARAMRRVYRDGSDQEARCDMAYASLAGGLALANAKLGAVHGFAGTLGGMFNAPHGAICAVLLPHVMQVNMRALQQREPNSRALMRYVGIARMLVGHDDASIRHGIDWAHSLLDEMQIPMLSSYGIREADFPTIIAKSKSSSSMKGNPIVLTEDELATILRGAL